MTRKKFGASLTDAQFNLARAFERAGLCTISAATRAFERHDDEQIKKWKQQLQDQSLKERANAMPQEQPFIVLGDLRKHIVYPGTHHLPEWTAQCQALIESIFLSHSIGLVEGYQDDTTGEIFVNGHQRRVRAILDFMDGKYKTWTYAQKLRVEPHLAPPIEPGKFFDELDSIAKEYFYGYRIHIAIARQEKQEHE